MNAHARVIGTLFAGTRPVAMAVLLSLSAWACSGPETVDKPVEPKPMQDQPPPQDETPPPPPPPPPTPTSVDQPPVDVPAADATPTADGAKDATAATAEVDPNAHPADIRKTSSPAETLLNDGINLARDNNLFDARQKLQAATVQDPKSATAWYNLALVQRRLGGLDEAIDSTKKAVEVNPTYARAVVLLSVLYLRKGEGTQALAVLDEALGRRPGDVMLMGAKARVLVDQKDYQRALDVGLACVRIDQDNPEAMRYLAEAYLGLGREGLARLALERAYAIYTGDYEPPAGTTPVAGSQRKAYEVRTARGGGTWRGIGAEALDRDAGMAHIYYLYGQMAMRKGDVVEAREDFMQSTKLRPDYAEALNNLGVCWIVAKKGEEAVEALSKCLEIEPNNFEARVNLGSAWRVSKDPNRADKAKAEYERAQKQDPRSPAPVFNLGILYLETQLPDVASGEARFQKALEYFAQYRDMRGSSGQGQKDPLDDYVQEAKNLLKIETDKRKVQEKAATEKADDAKKKAEEDAKKAELAKKKAEDDAAKAAEEAKKKAEEDAQTPQPAPPGDTPPGDKVPDKVPDGQPTPPADPTPAPQPTPPADPAPAPTPPADPAPAPTPPADPAPAPTPPADPAPVPTPPTDAPAPPPPDPPPGA